MVGYKWIPLLRGPMVDGSFDITGYLIVGDQRHSFSSPTVVGYPVAGTPGRTPPDAAD